MPPLRPQPALLPRSSTITSTITSTSTNTSISLAQRAFLSSTPMPRRQTIPPESPLYINVPNPPQDQSIEARRELKPVKGHLPLPRAVFRHRDAHLKPTAGFLARSAPAPSSARSQQAPGSEIQAWKRRMAAGRRANLGSGLRDLWARKQALDQRRAADRTAKLAANRAAATAPERDDDRLTRASIGAATRATAVAPDPGRFERALAARAATGQLAAERSERRRDAIQELYMNARLGPFVIDEAGLEAVVEREFGEDKQRGGRKFQGQSPTGQQVVSVWDLEGTPDTVADMLREVSGRDGRVIVDMATQRSKTEKRQMRVAEELTGGKMDLLSRLDKARSGKGGGRGLEK